MTKEYKYKKQGDGRDSFECTEREENGAMINRYMVYEDPYVSQKTDLSNIDISSLTKEQLSILKKMLSDV